MTHADRKTWEAIKHQYLREVSKALSSVRHPKCREVVEEVGAHLDRRFEELAPDQRDPDNLRAIIISMGPASDYAELLGPQAARTRTGPCSRRVLYVATATLSLILAFGRGGVGRGEGLRPGYGRRYGAYDSGGRARRDHDRPGW